MNNKDAGILVGFLFALSVFYSVEAYDEIIEDEDYIKGGFFIFLVGAHLVMSYFLYTKTRRIHIVIICIGTMALIVLYVITHLDIESIGSFGLAMKMMQISILFVTLRLYKSMI